MRHLNRRNVISVVIYAAGLASLFSIDFTVSHYGSISDISLWAFLKSTVVLVGFVALIGADQSIVRNVSRVGRKTFRQACVVFLAIGPVSAIILSRMRDDTPWWMLLPLVVAISFSGILGAFERAKYQLVSAQLLSNAWKICLAVAIVGGVLLFGAPNVQVATAVAAGGSLFTCFCFAPEIFKKIRMVDDQDAGLGFWLDGARFLMMGATLNLSVNLEQVLLNGVGAERAGAEIFAYTTAFGSSFIFVSGFYGFVLAPYVRNNRDQILRSMRRFVALNVLIGLVLCSVSFGIGTEIFNFLYKNKFELDIHYMLLVIGIFFLRFLYVVPSSTVGFIGSSRLFNTYLGINMASLAIYVGAFFAMYEVTGNGVRSVLLASVVNWLIRVSTGLVMSMSIKQGSAA